MACCECCDNPGYQNFNRWALLACTVIAWVFSVVTLAHCSFWQLDNNDNGFGLFSMKVDGSCESYDDVFYNFDESSSHKTGKAFGILANLSIATCVFGLAAVTLFLNQNGIGKIVWLVTKILYIVAMICVLITFTFVKECDDNYGDTYLSDYCELGAAGILNVMNFWILLGVCIAAWIVPLPNPVFGRGSSPAQQSKPEVEEEQAPPQAGATITKTIMETPEGRKIIEEVTNPDGTKTITETMEVAA